MRCKAHPRVLRTQIPLLQTFPIWHEVALTLARYGPTDPQGVAQAAAMQRFVSALKTRNHTAFLSAFSRAAPSYHLNPQNIGSRTYDRTALSYADLAAAVSRKKG